LWRTFRRNDAEGPLMGRKKKMKIEEKVELRMRLDSDLMERVKAVADDRGLAVAAWVRSTIIQELKRIEREENE
jgi:predicted DNA binding CopG/RHH family protein